MTPESVATANRPTAARRMAVLLLLGAVLAMTLSWAIWRGQPVALPEIRADARLPCVSYAPFRRAGDTPFDPTLLISPAAIEADLRLLATVTGCVRTYGLDHGLDAVPAIARRLGLRVVLGTWIGRNAAANESQLRRALQLAREYQDVVQLLVVGNEVLLRGDLPATELAGLLARAHGLSPVPVTYADVWEFWLRHAPVLREHVDVITAHILPYWEDEPVDIDQAVEHVYAIAAQMKATFGDMPLFVGETGWPAAGRQRGPAVPGRLEQARFVRELQARQAVEPLSFNLIEGFDQPWKRDLEGAMGGAWGLFDAAGKLRVPLAGPVVPVPQWFWLPMAALFGATGALVAGCLRQRATKNSNETKVSLLALTLAGALIGVFSLLQASALPLWSRSGWEWAVGSVGLGISVACSVAAAWRLAHLLRGGSKVSARWLVLAQSALLFVVAVEALGLVFDARYRPLPWPALAAPALLLSTLAWLGDRLPADAREGRLLAAVCAVCAVLVAVFEGAANGQAMLYSALLLALALASLWPPHSPPHRAPPEDVGGNNARAANSAAGAARSVE
jgi:exo-beta-1,3-glucanase (GH17 family)